ncbi:MAG: serine/threonine-protein kinase [Planctomycetota bacterium]
MPSPLRCPRCTASVDTPPCPVCGCRFDPLQRPTADEAPAGGDAGLIADVAGAVNSERYAVEACLAVGGMGVVLRGQRIRDHHPIIVKAPRRSDRQAAERFTREARALATCDHPYIPRLLDIDVTREERPLLVLEYCDGHSLREHVSEDTIPASLFENMVRCVAEALTHCHRRGVVHRDVKPENIVVGTDRCLLIDFGLARLLEDDSPIRQQLGTITPAGSLLGTPPYTAPEQLRRPSSADGRADVYALGMVMRECLPHCRDMPPDRSALWLRLVEGLCDPDPQRRPALDHLIATSCEWDDPVQAPHTARRRQLGWLVGATASGVLAAILLLAWLIEPASPRTISGSIAPDRADRIGIRLGPDGHSSIRPLGDTRIRLPGGGPWTAQSRRLQGEPHDVVQLYIRAPDGSWEVAVD